MKSPSKSSLIIILITFIPALGYLIYLLFTNSSTPKESLIVGTVVISFFVIAFILEIIVGNILMLPFKLIWKLIQKLWAMISQKESE